MLHEQDASPVGAKLQCWKGRVGKTHIGVSRGPQLFGPRVRGYNQKSPHWACHRHLSMLELLYCWFVKMGNIYWVVRNFPYCKPSQALWVHPLRGHQARVITLGMWASVCGTCYFMAEQSYEWVFPGKPTWLLRLPWKEASNTQLQSWPSIRLHDRVVSRTRPTFIVDTSFAGLQWYAWVMTLGYVGHLWVVSTISLRSSTER